MPSFFILKNGGNEGANIKFLRFYLNFTKLPMQNLLL